MERSTFISHIGPGNVKHIGQVAMEEKSNKLKTAKGLGAVCVQVNNGSKDMLVFAINDDWLAVYNKDKRLKDRPGVGANLEGLTLGKLAQTGRTDLPSTCNPEEHFDFGEWNYPGSAIKSLQFGLDKVKISASFTGLDDDKLNLQVAEAGVDAMVEMVERIWDSVDHEKNQ